MMFEPRPSFRGASRRWRCSDFSEDPVKRPSKAIVVAGVVLLAGGAWWLCGQDAKNPVFRTKVALVVLSFTVTDNKGHYINGLKPGDFRILEDGIVEKISTFAEGNKPAVQVGDDGSLRPLIASGSEPSKPGIFPRSDAFVVTIVFFPFHTTNFSYLPFSYAPSP